ncbi:hypothetical protein [Streptomyces yaizuensis]|uniref:Uncharacterized protein n=1 Tax=Streptomyces yaizuensis TaxID=2989713 RepID=A0AA86IVJ2_9ACTN|nr:hypothetical protein [Streptomyces sp. YSPA8]BDT39465.1 hypothetical protein SYYSPA8_36735 [Streptomyces sp. YSPA8]
MADDFIPHQGRRPSHPSLRGAYALTPRTPLRRTMALMSAVTLSVCIVLGWASILVAHVLTPALR